MARKPVLIMSAFLALAVSGAIGASVSAYAGGTSTPTPPNAATTAPPKPIVVTPAVPPPLHAKTAALAGQTNAAVVPNVHCGEKITASVTMNVDLTCPQQVALTITKPSVTLNLNGHVIVDGDPSDGVGVLVGGNSDIVENGIITAANVGVLIHTLGDGVRAPTSVKVTNIRATYDYTGIADEGGGIAKITANIVEANLYGIIESSSLALIKGNIATSNGVDGIDVNGAVLANVTGNQADSNHQNGIVTENSRATTIASNTANFNGYDGIANGDFDTADGGGNLAKGNDYNAAASATPEQCSGIACN